MELAFVLDIWHMFVCKIKHLNALKANILPIPLDLVLSIGLLNEYLWMIDVLALGSIPALKASIPALKALYIAIKFYPFPHDISVQQGA